MANKECTKCIHNAVCKTAESCDGCVSGCKHFMGWISVKDRLPEKYGRYLALTPSRLKGKEYDEWLIYYLPQSGFYDTDPEWGDIEMDDVTHWMPLPEAPKGE